MTKYILVMFAMLFVCVSSASAQGTPDNMPPAEETVCGAEPAPGRGLCVAYCEAMDCDSDPNANQNACDNVKAKWQNKTGGTDLPCEMACPCNDIPGYLAISSGAEPILECLLFGEQDTIIIARPDSQTSAIVDLEHQVCIFFFTFGGVALPLSPEEAATCYAELEAQATSQGLECSPVL